MIDRFSDFWVIFMCPGFVSYSVFLRILLLPSPVGIVAYRGGSMAAFPSLFPASELLLFSRRDSCSLPRARCFGAAALTASVFVHNRLPMTHLCQEVCLLAQRHSRAAQKAAFTSTATLKGRNNAAGALRGESTGPRYDESESKINLPPQTPAGREKRAADCVLFLPPASQIEAQSILSVPFPSTLIGLIGTC